MPLAPEKLYAAHVANLRAVDNAADHVYLQLKRCIASQQTIAADALLKLYMFLVGAWAEVRLLKLLYERQGFQDRDRNLILETKGTQIDRWKYTLELAFRRRFSVPTGTLEPPRLDLAIYAQFVEVVNLLENDLRPIIEIRNKLAHGQWSRALTNDLLDVSRDKTRILNTENAFTIHQKRSIIDNISRIINDLVAIPTVFNKYFDLYYRPLVQAKINLRTRRYNDWESSLRDKYVRGALARNNRT